MSIAIRFLTLLAGLFGMMPSVVHAQQPPQTWYFGYNASLVFTPAGPVPAEPGRISSVEGGAVGNHPITGELLFYTDGATVWNADHTEMEYGSGLHGHWSSAQSALIVPWPCDATKYLLVTSGQEGYEPIEPRHGVEWAVVHHSGTVGKSGRIVSKNNVLLDSASEQLTAIRHTNGNDYWIVAHGRDGNEFYVYLLTRDGLQIQPIISKAGSPQDARSVGTLKASPDGRRLALGKVGPGKHGNLAGHAELFSFEASSGIVSNGITVWDVPVYGVSFSPDSKMLYAAEYSGENRIAQFEADRDVPGDIIASRTIVGRSIGQLKACQLGPDGKIYIAVYDQHWLSAIDQPNVIGAGCRFIDNAVDLGDRRSSSGLPNNIDARGAGPYPACLLQATISASTDSLCAGGCTTIRIVESSNLVRWSWRSEGGMPVTAVGVAEYVVCFDRPGIHRVTLTGTDGFDTITATLDVRVAPRPVVDAGPSLLVCTDSVVTLPPPVVYGSAVGSYRWSPANLLDCPECPSPTARVDSTTLFTVMVTDAFGCTAEDTVRVYVGERTIVASVPDPILDTIPDTVDVPVRIRGLFEGVEFSAIQIRLTVDSAVARFVPPDPLFLRQLTSGTPLEEWDLEILSSGIGHIYLRATPRIPVRWGSMDTTILRARAYALLSERSDAPIDCEVSFVGAECIDVVNQPGRLIAEICGRPQRLMEMFTPHRITVRNQADGVVLVSAILSSSTPIRVVLYDQRGGVARTTVSDGASQEHLLSFDMADLPAGAYYLTVDGTDVYWQTRLIHYR